MRNCRYDGEWTHDKKHGTGKMRITFALPDIQNNLQWTYEGEWENGLPHGTGRLENTDGTVFNGSLRDSAPHGFGTLCAGQGHDKACVQIDFEAGLAIGEGTVVAGSRRYAIDCGKADDDCYLVPKASEDGVPSSLRFETVTSLWERVLPSAITDGLVVPVAGAKIDL